MKNHEFLGQLLDKYNSPIELGQPVILNGQVNTVQGPVTYSIKKQKRQCCSTYGGYDPITKRNIILPGDGWTHGTAQYLSYKTIDHCKRFNHNTQTYNKNGEWIVPYNTTAVWRWLDAKCETCGKTYNISTTDSWQLPQFISPFNNDLFDKLKEVLPDEET